MSTDQSTQPSSYACSGPSCEAEFEAGNAIRGSYCSTECYLRDRGESILNKIRHDHRLCATCFRPVKEISRPSSDWTEEKSSRVQLALDNGATFQQRGDQLTLDATGCESEQTTAAGSVVGLQSPTENQVWAIDDVADRDTDRRHQPRWGCECGNVDLSSRDEALERAQHEQVVLDCLRTLFVFEREDQIPHHPSKTRLFETLREHGRDWPLAIGRAVYDH